MTSNQISNSSNNPIETFNINNFLEENMPSNQISNSSNYPIETFNMNNFLEEKTNKTDDEREIVNNFTRIKNKLAKSNIENKTVLMETENVFKKMSPKRLYRVWLKSLCQNVNSSLFKVDQHIDNVDLRKGDYFEIIKLRDNSIKTKTFGGISSPEYHLMLLIIKNNRIRNRNDSKMEWTTLGFGPMGWASPDYYFLEKCEKLIKEHIFIEKSDIENNIKKKILKTFVEKEHKNRSGNKKNIKNIENYIRQELLDNAMIMKNKIIDILVTEVTQDYEKNNITQEDYDIISRKLNTERQNGLDEFINFMDIVDRYKGQNKNWLWLNKIFIYLFNNNKEFYYLTSHLFSERYKSHLTNAQKKKIQKWSIKKDIKEIKLRDNQKISVLASSRFTKKQIERLKNLIKMQCNNVLSKRYRTPIMKIDYISYDLSTLFDFVINKQKKNFLASVTKSNLYDSPSTSYDNFLKFFLKFLPKKGRRMYDPFGQRRNKYKFAMFKDISDDFYAHNCASSILSIFPKLIRSVSPIVTPATIRPIHKFYENMVKYNKDRLFFFKTSIK